MAQTAEEIASQLRELIRTGAAAPGERLPTMEALAAEHGVSRQTARQALNQLKAEGLVEYKGGRTGTFVRERPGRRMVRSRSMERDGLGYYSGSNVQHWRLVAGTRTEVATAPVPPDIAELLGVGAGEPVVVRKRLNGDPENERFRQLTDSWLHPTVVAELPALTGDSGLGGIYDRIEEWAGQPIAWEEEITAATPSPSEATALLLPPGVPLLRVIRTSTVRIEGKTLIAEVNDIRMSGELFSVKYPLTRRGAAAWPVAPATADFYQG
ncbi:GntR family transcriptional regulator [Streptomyces harbinensis]|uniref:GntR family transcriptional regulator n=1 Tax=Streptomyces harbinensis TaxID=1176198 RepID=A0A1I6QGS6_9ACTN|nr:GntR family transcriptional regulator [Streptomyces harbinensis]SFS51488.1 GntR family transcriptional regulator [Streptomyces harbinensis]